MARHRVTRDEWDVLADYGQGWEVVTCEPTRREALRRVMEYRANAPEGRYKMRLSRVRCEDAPTPVLFRREAGGVLAIFPALPGTNDPLTMPCYSQTGQHATCSEEYVRGGVPATPAEYAPLLAELELIGYDNLVIRDRLNHRDRQNRLRNR